MRPSRNRSRGRGRWGWVGLAVLAGILGGDRAPARAQGFGPDPYNPYNSRYEPFVYPVAPGPLDYGYNQGFSPTTRSGSALRGANQFENYMNSLRGPGNARSGGGTGAGAGTPYFRANRTFDRDYDRVYQYRPNRDTDAKFDANQEEVSKLYFRYLREKDPKKRAEIFREYSRARNQADRDLSGSTNSRTRGTSRPARRDSAAPRPEDLSRGSTRDANPPPPIDSAGTRAGRGRSAGGTRPGTAAGPAPTPLEDEGSMLDTPKAATPSRVLDRALRTAPAGRGPTRRSTAPSSVGEPPPP